MDFNLILTEIKDYIHTYFRDHHDPKYVYHDIEHTERVVKACREIGNHFQLNDTDFFTVVAAGWFHDIGYMTLPENHEAESAHKAEAFLKEKGVSNKIIQSVKGCILATKMPQSPKSLLEEIACDADLYHLGTKDFGKLNKRMREEAELIHGGKKISKQAWNEKTVELLKSHHYHTQYCQILLEGTKAENWQELEKKLEKELKKEKDTDENEKKDKKHGGKEALKDILQEKGLKKEDDFSKLDKGVQTLFRVLAGNNQHLSRLADYKARMMVSVNSIILSIVLGLILKELNIDSYLAIPTYLILAVCLLAIVFSVLAIRPNLPKITFSPEEVKQKKINMLFFGNFYQLSMQEYIDIMKDLIKDSDDIYTTLIKDTYSEGIVLARKYRLIRISYDIFLFGIISSVLAFVVATLLR